MNDFKEESRNQNKQNNSEHTNSASDHQTPIYDSTLQRKVSSKIEINITRKQLNAAKWLFEQAGKRKPDWLRKKFYVNQYRRKTLNVELKEAQLDEVYCGHARNEEDWDGLLHTLWHQINGVLLCK